MQYCMSKQKYVITTAILALFFTGAVTMGTHVYARHHGYGGITGVENNWNQHGPIFPKSNPDSTHISGNWNNGNPSFDIGHEEHEGGGDSGGGGSSDSGGGSDNGGGDSGGGDSGGGGDNGN
jgi:hypothetical protein